MLGEAYERAIQTVLETSNWEIGHVQHVRRLAVALFLALRELHGLPDDGAILLEAAAMLHDVGYPTDPENHHKLSARIIRASLGPPFTPQQVDFIAILARYHRKGVPQIRHRRFAALDDRGRRKVTWLAGILRVADGLDRAHVCAVQSIRASVVYERLEIRVADRSSTEFFRLDVEPPRGEALATGIEGAVRKRDLLERALGVPVVIHAV